MISAQERLADEFGVSRETLEKLEAYVALVQRWTRKINLIGPKTVSEIWDRHILDSAQIFPLLNGRGAKIADFGSGAGFPGLVLAILRTADDQIGETHLVESDQRKAAFLRTVARETQAPVTVHAVRVESLTALGADIITARALAPLSTLLPFVQRHGHAATRAVFLKGQAAAQELDDASANWSFTCRQHPSITDPNAHIIELGDIRERRDAP